MPSASFDALSGIPARRPSKSEREAAAKDCLSKPRSAGAKREVKRMLLVVHGVVTGGGGANNPALGTFRVRCRALQLEAVEAAAEVDGGDGSLVP